MRPRWSILLLGLCCVLSGCRRQGARAELAELERRYAEDAAKIDGVAVDLDRLTATQRQILATYATAKREWETAAILYQEASSQQELTARTMEQAAADFGAAERYYRAATMAMVTMAAGSIICAGAMNTAKFRRQLKREGIQLDRTTHVDHIFPRSHGGLDHPLNYQLLDSSLNQSLSDKIVRKFMQAPIGFVTGMAVSALGVVGGCN